MSNGSVGEVEIFARTAGNADGMVIDDEVIYTSHQPMALKCFLRTEYDGEKSIFQSR